MQRDTVCAAVGKATPRDDRSTHTNLPGALEHFDRVTIHPYRSDGPETAWPDFGAVADLVAEYAPPFKTPVPLVSGEWGYGAAVVGGHLYVSDLDPSVPLTASLVLVPVALVSIYLPTIAGLGAREASFVVLFGMVGVAEADATAAALGVLATTLLTALLGAIPLLRGRLGGARHHMRLRGR